MPRRRRFRQPRAFGSRHVALGQAHRTAELARRDIDQHLVHRPAAQPIFPQRGFPTGKRLLLAVEATKPRPSIATLPPWKPILPVVLPQRCALLASLRACRGPQAACASRAIMSPRASSPAARHSFSKLADRLVSASIFNSLAGIAPEVINVFMALLSFRGIITPSLQAQGGQRRSSYFNIDRDIPHRGVRGDNGLPDAIVPARNKTPQAINPTPLRA